MTYHGADAVIKLATMLELAGAGCHVSTVVESGQGR